ncbi:MAG TPA: hypothetical protein VKZ50_05880 [bacterium]|nr:hypothetical protein [bacterium]
MENAEKLRDGVSSLKPKEHELTKAIEAITAPIPSSAYLGVAVAAMGVSLMLMLSGRKDAAQFIGHWAPAILIMGLYNKLVKQLGSD